MWTLIRLLLHKQMTKQMTVVVIGSLRVNRNLDCGLSWASLFLAHLSYAQDELL